MNCLLGSEIINESQKFQNLTLSSILNYSLSDHCFSHVSEAWSSNTNCFSNIVSNSIYQVQFDISLHSVMTQSKPTSIIRKNLSPACFSSSVHDFDRLDIIGSDNALFVFFPMTCDFFNSALMCFIFKLIV